MVSARARQRGLSGGATGPAGKSRTAPPADDRSRGVSQRLAACRSDGAVVKLGAVMAVSCVPAFFAWRYFSDRLGADLNAPSQKQDVADAEHVRIEKAQLLERLKRNPQEVGSLKKLCDIYDRELRRYRSDEVVKELVACNTAMVTLLESIVPKVTWYSAELSMELAVVSADRVLAVARGDVDRLEVAAKGFSLALRNESRCAAQPELLPFGEDTAGSCVRVWAKLCLVLKQLGQKVDPGIWSGPAYLQNTPHLQLPGIRARASWSVSEIAWLSRIGDDLRTAVLAEWGSVLSKKATEQTLIASGRGVWRSHTLFINNEWDEGLCSLCPRICGLLKPLPELSLSNMRLPTESIKPPELMATFHSLRAGERLLPHFGSHGRLIASLGVDGWEHAELRVGGETLTWSPERFIIFDDAFEHEVVHFGSKPRVVFSVNFLHPDIS